MKEQDAAHSFTCPTCGGMGHIWPDQLKQINEVAEEDMKRVFENADLRDELTRLRSELQKAKQEIANHTMVNNLLLDGDDDAKIANVIYNLVCELNKAKSELAPVERAFLAGRSQTSWKQFQEDEKAKLNN